jgi:hypothetical protein
MERTALLALGPFFERFFILGGPRGTRQKKLQNSDPMHMEAGSVEPGTISVTLRDSTNSGGTA